MYGKDSYKDWRSYNSNVIVNEYNLKMQRLPTIIKRILSKEIVKKNTVIKANNYTIIIKKLKTVIDNQDLILNFSQNKILKY